MLLSHNSSMKLKVGVGVILDMNSPVGKTSRHYISMAISDFYANNANYSTRLALSFKDSGNDTVAAASAGNKFLFFSFFFFFLLKSCK